MGDNMNMDGPRKKIADSVIEKASAMRFNPFSASSGISSLNTDFPDLFSIDAVKAFSQRGGGNKDDQIWRNKVVRYMIWLYSVDTVLNVKPAEPLKDRKLKALYLAGFRVDPETNRFDDKLIHDITELADEDFVAAAVAYIIFQKSELFSELIVCEEQHHELIRLRMTPATSIKDAADKDNLRDKAKGLIEDIKMYWEEFWEDNDDLRDEGTDMVYQSIEDRARINMGT